MFQFSAGAPITNFLSTGTALLGLTAAAVAGGDAAKVPASVGICLGVIFIFKFVGANLMRLYLRLTVGKEGAQL